LEGELDGISCSLSDEMDTEQANIGSSETTHTEVIKAASEDSNVSLLQ